jgi:prepilin-type N-terminal cleavage/methylation domain-containing protein
MSAAHPHQNAGNALRRVAGLRLDSDGPQSGLTLIELMVTILVVGIMAGGILGVFVTTLRTFSTGQVRMQNQDEARLAMNQMTRYLRMASASESITTTRSDAIAVAGAQDVVFYADIDGDGVVEKGRYYLSGTTLRMQTAEPNMGDSPPTYPAFNTSGEVVREAVRNGGTAIFRYYREGESVPMTSTSTFDLREEIALIEVTLYVNEVPELSRSNVRLVSRVLIRQRYDGGLTQ